MLIWVRAREFYPLSWFFRNNSEIAKAENLEIYGKNDVLSASDDVIVTF